MLRTSSARGFTLIEVMIVVTLVVILASVGMATYTNSVHRAREAVLKEDLFRMRDAIDQFYADRNQYPQGLEDLVSEGYLREIPKDPMTDSTETWNVEQSENDANNPAAVAGIVNVRSGSEAVSPLNGSKYAEW